MRYLVVLGLAVLLAACQPPQTWALRQRADARLSRTTTLHLPYIVTPGDELCGAASLATLLSFAGRPVDEKTLAAATYTPGRHGALSVEMLAAARRQGLLALQLQPEMADLLDQLQAGRPVLVLENRALSFWPRYHYAVISAWDARQREWVLHSGAPHPERLPMPVFERIWMRAGGFAMVVIDPYHLPPDLPLEQLLRAATDLERVQPAAALAAYEQLALRAPADARLPLLAGNALRELGRLKAAERSYRASLALQTSWQAMNNLADLLQALGRHPEALVWAQKAAAMAPQSVATQTLHHLLREDAAAQAH